MLYFKLKCQRKKDFPLKQSEFKKLYFIFNSRIKDLDEYNIIGQLLSFICAIHEFHKALLRVRSNNKKYKEKITNFCSKRNNNIIITNINLMIIIINKNN